MNLADIQLELLRAEFPFLRPDHDPDIERYYELRSAGRPSDALALYESRLRPRYPNDAFRAAAMRAYRLHDPAYSIMLSKAYMALGERLLEQTKRLIKYVALRAQSYNPTDAFSTIKAAENITAMLPRERFEAIAAIERLRRFADRLHYCERAMAVAEDLVRAYLTESLDVVETEKERRRAAREKAEVERRRLLVEQDKADLRRNIAAYRKRANEAAMLGMHRREESSRTRKVAEVFDLSHLRFSAADLSRIQIPPTLTKMEDKTLAFCFKYWNLVNDDSFERVLFLYSRKYGTKHYEVFSAIRLGRRAGKRDDEILAAISSILITGYYYSIRGDIYIQRNWVLLKRKLEQSSDTMAVEQTLRRRRPRQKRKEQEKKAEAAPNQEAAKEIEPKRQIEAVEPQVIATELPSVEKRTIPAESPQKVKKSISGGSVSDRLRKLSGRSYDVYQDRFLARVRVAIRKVLSDGRDGHKGLFSSIPQEVEELLVDFLRTHYSDPYMDWAGSEEKTRLASLGYQLDSVDGIIEDCYRRL